MGIDEIFSRTDANGARHFLTDALGSIVGLTGNSGTPTTRYIYEPFGKVTVSGVSNDNPLQYTSRENDGTGLCYYRARYYHPGLQRLISKDPVGIAGGVNLYAYVGNDPVNFVDPLGLMKLPGDPSGLPPEWQHDSTHLDPNGSRWRHLSGDILDFHRGRPMKPGQRKPRWKNKDHWHHNEDDKHLSPGDECPIAGESPEPESEPPPEFRGTPIPWWLPLIPILTPWPDPY